MPISTLEFARCLATDLGRCREGIPKVQRRFQDWSRGCWSKMKCTLLCSGSGTTLRAYCARGYNTMRATLCMCMCVTPCRHTMRCRHWFRGGASWPKLPAEPSPVQIQCNRMPNKLQYGIRGVHILTCGGTTFLWRALSDFRERSSAHTLQLLGSPRGDHHCEREGLSSDDKDKSHTHSL